MANSFLKVIDEGVRAYLYTKYGTIMSLSSLTNDTAILPKASAFRMISENRGRAVVEFINCYRRTTQRAKDRARTSAARHGISMEYEDASIKDVIQVKAVPANLEYDVYFWSLNPEILNQVEEAHLFGPYSTATLDLNFGTSYPVNMFIHHGDITEDGTVEQLDDKGLYFIRHTTLNVEGWVFSVIDSKTVKEIMVTFYDNTSGNNVLLSQQTLECSGS